MELQNFVTLQIQTFDPNANSLRVSIPAEDDEVSVETILSKVLEHLGLKKSSWKYFALFQGLDDPLKKYKAVETLLIPNKDVSLQKWCFDPREEKTLIRSDSQAAHLLCLQAQHDISSGKLQPTESEKHKLDECMDPDFLMEEQYVSICQKMDNYHSVRVPNCQLCLPTVIQETSLPRNSVLCIFVSKHGLRVSSDDCDSSNISWHEVMKWAWNEGERTLTYTIQLTQCPSPIVVSVMTAQAEYLLQATLEGIRALMVDDEDSPVFHASMISVHADGSKQWDNCIFDPDKARSIKQAMYCLAKKHL